MLTPYHSGTGEDPNVPPCPRCPMVLLTEGGEKQGPLTCQSCGAVRGGLYEIESERLLVSREGKRGCFLRGWRRLHCWCSAHAAAFMLRGLASRSILLPCRCPPPLYNPPSSLRSTRHRLLRPCACPLSIVIQYPDPGTGHRICRF